MVLFGVWDGEFELDSIGGRYSQWDEVVIRIFGDFDIERLLRTKYIQT